MIVVAAGLVMRLVDDRVVAADMNRLSVCRRVVIVRRLRTRKPRARAGERNDRADNRAEQRQENNREIHQLYQPFIKLMSSTAIEPRLRK
jgi:hypothetical protein